MNEWTRENADTALLFGVKERYTHKGETISIPTFRGHEVSAYGIDNGQVDLACFVQGMNHILCNNIIEVDPQIFENRVCGYLYRDANGNFFEEEESNREEEDDEDCGEDEEDGDDVCADEDDGGERWLIDFYQFYIVDEAAVSLLEKIGETVCYSDVLDCNIWCVSHVGTPWTGILTGIRIPQ